MYKIAVLGDRDSIYGFASVGLDTYPVTTLPEAARTLHNLAAADYAVIYITENYASQLPGEIGRYKAQVLPAIITLPGVTGNTGMGITQIKKSVEQAVGSDILFGGV